MTPCASLWRFVLHGIGEETQRKLGPKKAQAIANSVLIATQQRVRDAETGVEETKHADK